MSQLESVRAIVVDDDVKLLESSEATGAERFVIGCRISVAEASRVLDFESFHVACVDWQMPPYADRRTLAIMRKPFSLERSLQTVSQFASVARTSASSEVPLRVESK